MNGPVAANKGNGVAGVAVGEVVVLGIGEGGCECE